MYKTIALGCLLLLTTLAMLPAEDPDTFRVKFETTAGDFVMEVHREWAPIGSDRIHALVAQGYYDGVRFHRVIKGFMVQWGVNGDPAVAKKWVVQQIKDDRPHGQSNTRGYVTFAKSDLPNSRTTQLFINYGDNSRLDRTGFYPVAKIVSGMDVVDKIFG